MFKVYVHDSYARLGLIALLSEINELKQIDMVVLFDYNDPGMPTLLKHWEYKEVVCVILNNQPRKSYLQFMNILMLDLSLSACDIKKSIENFIFKYIRSGMPLEGNYSLLPKTQGFL